MNLEWIPLEELELRRSKRKKIEKYLGLDAFMFNIELDPKNYKEAVSP